MKFLFDENLSHRLVEAVRDLFPGSLHVLQVGLARGTSDRQIWDFAKQNGFAVITGDTDFVTLANTFGPPPKVVLLENCDYPTREASRLIRANVIRLSEFEADNNPLLILRKQ
jgi:predicted nuclease of predicted toxin-antitoxin system